MCMCNVYATFKPSPIKTIVMSQCDAQLIYPKMHLALTTTATAATAIRVLVTIEKVVVTVANIPMAVSVFDIIPCTG